MCVFMLLYYAVLKRDIVLIGYIFIKCLMAVFIKFTEQRCLNYKHIPNLLQSAADQSNHKLLSKSLVK